MTNANDQAGAPDGISRSVGAGGAATAGEAPERYRRQLRLPGFGAEQQRRLGGARIAVIGAGGLGCPVLEYLVAAGAGRPGLGGSITLIDPDRVDRSNLHRQLLHGESSIGALKVESAAARLRALDPEVALAPIAEALTVGSALRLLRGHDLVIDGTDNFPTRYLVSDACELLDVPVVWGSILAYAGQVSVFFGDGGRGVTYRDVHPVPPGPGEVPGCAEAGVLGMLCGVVGSVMALEAVKTLCGVGETLHGRIALFDALAMRWDELPVARDPERASVTELEDLTVTCGLPGVAASEGARGGTDVEAAELGPLRARGVRLIDIREADEVARGMLEGAEHIPSARLLADPAAAGELDGAVLYCAAGRRSDAARTALAARGITVRALRGGYDAVAGEPGGVPRDG